MLFSEHHVSKTMQKNFQATMPEIIFVTIIWRKSFYWYKFFMESCLVFVSKLLYHLPNIVTWKIVCIASDTKYSEDLYSSSGHRLWRWHRMNEFIEFNGHLLAIKTKNGCLQNHKAARNIYCTIEYRAIDPYAQIESSKHMVKSVTFCYFFLVRNSNDVNSLILTPHFNDVRLSNYFTSKQRLLTFCSPRTKYNLTKKIICAIKMHFLRHSFI